MKRGTNNQIKETIVFLENSKIQIYEFEEFITNINLRSNQITINYKNYFGKKKKLIKSNFLNNLELNTFSKINKKKESTRQYKQSALSFSQISNLLLASYFYDKKRGKYNIPSGGGLYPINIYIINLKIRSLDYGIYLYNVENKYLSLIKKISNMEIEKLLVDGFKANQREDINFKNASAIILFGLNINDATSRYGNRGGRFSLFDVGCILQNLYLSSAALNVGICANGGYIDNILLENLELNEQTNSIVLTAVLGKV